MFHCFMDVWLIMPIIMFDPIVGRMANIMSQIIVDPIVGPVQARKKEFLPPWFK